MKINHESLTGTFEQQRELVRSFNLMDDDFFAVVMQDKKAFEVMLRILTQRDDLRAPLKTIVPQMRSQIFRQIVLKFCRHTGVCQEILVQNDGKYASR